MSYKSKFLDVGDLSQDIAIKFELAEMRVVCNYISDSC